MTQRDVQDHWNSLANQLGAEPRPITPPASPKPAQPPTRRVASVVPLRSSSTDWAQVAVQLGVVPPEPLAEARKWRLRETPEPVRRDVERAKAAEKREPSVFGAGLLPDMPVKREEAPAAIVEEASTEPAPWLDEIESEEAPKEPRRRRRRRRSRDGRGERPDREERERAEDEAERGEEPEDAGAAGVIGETSVEARDFEAELEDAELDVSRDTEARGETAVEDRPRRGRRRRGRRGGEGREERRRSDEPAVQRGDYRERPAETAVPTPTDGQPPGEDEEDDDQEVRAEDHRNIPSWQESIGIIIEKNMEARSKNPNPYRPRGRGRGRG